MKRIISIILALELLIFTCGCRNSVGNAGSSVDLPIQNSLAENSDSTFVSEEQTPQEQPVSSEKGQSKNAQKSHSKTQKEDTKKATQENKIPQQKEAAFINRLPQVKLLSRNKNMSFSDIDKLPGGSFLISATRDTKNRNVSIVQLYNQDATFKKEISFENGNGFDKIAVCSDGGFVAASYCPPCVTKINSQFETEWFMPYEDVATEGTVCDIKEITADMIAVLFLSNRTPDFGRKLKISYLNKKGELIETVDLMRHVDLSDAKIIVDGHGGYFLFATCNETLANKYPLVAQNYDGSKGTEAVVMHFSKDRELTWVKTLGGGGDDWLEEAEIDSKGNIYLALGTAWYGADSFWEMTVKRNFTYRRQLVKLNQEGTLVYKVPLSNMGMAVDQVCGIHIRGNRVFVTGMANYFDGYQSKYPCSQILPTESASRIFCVYDVCIDSDGKELDRRIFRCDPNNEPCDSVLLPNGSLVIAGRISKDENYFDLDFPSGVDWASALFVFDE